MGVLNLRNVPDEVIARLKSEAYLHKEKMHAFCVGILARAVGAEKGEPIAHTGWQTAENLEQIVGAATSSLTPAQKTLAESQSTLLEGGQLGGGMDQLPEPAGVVFDIGESDPHAIDFSPVPAGESEPDDNGIDIRIG